MNRITTIVCLVSIVLLLVLLAIGYILWARGGVNAPEPKTGVHFRVEEIAGSHVRFVSECIPAGPLKSRIGYWFLSIDRWWDDSDIDMDSDPHGRVEEGVGYFTPWDSISGRTSLGESVGGVLNGMDDDVDWLQPGKYRAQIVWSIQRPDGTTEELPTSWVDFSVD